MNFQLRAKRELTGKGDCEYCELFELEYNHQKYIVEGIGDRPFAIFKGHAEEVDPNLMHEVQRKLKRYAKRLYGNQEFDFRWLQVEGHWHCFVGCK